MTKPSDREIRKAIFYRKHDIRDRKSVISSLHYTRRALQSLLLFGREIRCKFVESPLVYETRGTWHTLFDGYLVKQFSQSHLRESVGKDDGAGRSLVSANASSLATH
jgi:hypothetical protein